MKTWKKYKQTYRESNDIFDFARQGDLRGLADILANDSKAQGHSSNYLDMNNQNSSGYSALMLAVYKGEKDFCEALLRLGADANSKDFVDNTVLMAAAFKGDIEIFKLLIQYGADLRLVNQSNMTLKDWALMFGRKNILQFIDENYSEVVTTSKFKLIFRFVKLGILTVITKYGKNQVVNNNQKITNSA